MTHSRNKGKRGELEFAHFLTSRGFPARRGQQFSGSPDSPDVVCDSLSGFNFEVKRVERFRLYPALKQAQDDSGGKIPVVAHRMSRKDWVVILDAEDFLDLIEKAGTG